MINNMTKMEAAEIISKMIIDMINRPIEYESCNDPEWKRYEKEMNALCEAAVTLREAVSAEHRQGEPSSWIYNQIGDTEWNSKFEKVEEVLGFKLFVWQKFYVAYGKYRQSGKTTAEVLRDLLFDVDAEPIDYYKNPPKDGMEREHMFCLREIKRKLDAAGIKTRPVFFCRADKERYENDMGIKKEYDEIDDYHSNLIRFADQKYTEFLFECLAPYGITKENVKENAHRIGASFAVNGVSYSIDNHYAFTIKMVLKHNGTKTIVGYEKVI